MIEVSGAGRIDAPDHWTCHRLGAIVAQRHDIQPVDPDLDYPLLGVRWYGEGAFLRETVNSDSSEAKTLQKVRAGDLIYNRLFAWKGSFGLVPTNLMPATHPVSSHSFSLGRVTIFDSWPITFSSLGSGTSLQPNRRVRRPCQGIVGKRSRSGTSSFPCHLTMNRLRLLISWMGRLPGCVKS